MTRNTVASITTAVEAAGFKLVVRDKRNKNENKYVVTDVNFNPVTGANKLDAIAEFLEAHKIEQENIAKASVSEVDEAPEEVTEEVAGEEIITYHTYRGYDFEVLYDRDGEYTFSVTGFETEIECLAPRVTEYGAISHARNQIDGYIEWTEECEEEAGGDDDSTEDDGEVAHHHYKGFDFTTEEGFGEYYFTLTDSAIYFTPPVTEYGFQYRKGAIAGAHKVIDKHLERSEPTLYHQCVINALTADSTLLENSHPMPNVQLALWADWRTVEPHQDEPPSCNIYQATLDAHQTTIDRWHQVTIELSKIGLYGESPNYYQMTMTERCEYQERRLVLAQECNAPKPPSYKVEAAQEALQNNITYLVIKNVANAIAQGMKKSATAIWDLIPADMRTTAKGILNSYREQITKQCSCFAEMVRATKILDCLPG